MLRAPAIPFRIWAPTLVGAIALLLVSTWMSERRTFQLMRERAESAKAAAEARISAATRPGELPTRD